jgi:hypothetical protein
MTRVATAFSEKKKPRRGESDGSRTDVQPYLYDDMRPPPIMLDLVQPNSGRWAARSQAQRGSMKDGRGTPAM